tara:strand:- start:1236 stop:1571 length:336 start_codon:yes stop_codon:yes gene_type:complete
MVRECRYCGDEFNQSEKIRLRGGYANVCIDCHDERPDPDANTPVYRGVVAGSGKMAAISIVRFQNNEDADDYVRSFNASSAFGNRKTNRCNSIPFEHVGVNIGSSNHKGKA